MNIRTSSSGKVFVIFLIIFVVLSLSLAGLAMFFLHQEKERREQTEVALQKSVANAAQLETKLQEAIKQGFLLQEKNKEADEKINGLLDDLELQKGISDQVKQENQSLQDQLAEATKAREELQAKITGNEEAAQKLPELQAQLQTAQDTLQELQQKVQSSEQRNRELEEALAKFQQQPQPSAAPGEEKPADVTVPVPAPEEQKTEAPAQPPQPQQQVEPPPQEEIQLGKIVVTPAKVPEGRILTVDGENEFVIVNLGANHGIKEGQVLSVSRGDAHLGDIKVTRVQPEMCAADPVSPLSSRQVRKDDQVTIQ
ncbi:MAG: hypothetical protein HZA29_01075 [Candidatus Omnitrophica bacterium]|nr:hypothetical protein [Candidatus Omnitrophota bacterium]